MSVAETAQNIEGNGWRWDPGIICPADGTATAGRIAQYRDYYRVKYEIAREVAPRLICEIGVRAGYSAWAFLQAAPDARYIGFDAENGRHGGAGGEDGTFSRWARKILAPYYAEIFVLNTQHVICLPVSGADLVHVDGDHTATGVIHDLALAYDAVRPGGLILVDDWDYIAGVRRGVKSWLSMNRQKVTTGYRKSLRGEKLIWRMT